MADGFFGSLGNDLIAANDHELRQLLAQVDATVPPLAQGRTKEHIDRYCIVHYLRTLEENGLLRYPLKLTRGENPAFRMDLDFQAFGLGVKEAGPGESFGARGYVGDEPERLWTVQVLAAIQEETKRFSSYQDLPDYQLLVYDNTELVALTGWTVTELPARLATAIQDWRGAEPGPGRHFSRWSVLRDRVLMYDIGGSGLLLPVPPSPSQPPLLPLTRLGVSEEDLRAFCRRHHIRKLGFFGSARGERFGPRSDVDVLVEFEPAYRIGLIGLAEVELELSRLLGRKADLRTVPDLSRYFREEVVREKTDLAYAAG